MVTMVVGMLYRIYIPTSLRPEDSTKRVHLDAMAPCSVTYNASGMAVSAV